MIKCRHLIMLRDVLAHLSGPVSAPRILYAEARAVTNPLGKAQIPLQENIYHHAREYPPTWWWCLVWETQFESHSDF